MRNLIVSSLVSLDGIHGDPQSWVGDYFDQQAAEESLAVLLDSDAMLMGRNTYDYFAPRLVIAVRAVPGADLPDAQVRLLLHPDGGGLEQHHDHPRRPRCRGARA